MKKILGLDLGVSSIGWAMVAEDGKNSQILGMGSRIVPLSVDDKNEFSSGNAISKNQKRTQKRTQRKGYDRYQLRRQNLIKALESKNMLPDKRLIEIGKTDLWGLRAKAVADQIGLKELGRVLLHINQKRGYKSSRNEATLEKKDTDYVAEVKNRHQLLIEKELTVGEFFYTVLCNNPFYRIKDQVFPREAYIEEFDAICKNQEKFYPDVLTSDFIDRLKNEIIFYQRKLKSQKGLVSICEFEGTYVKAKSENGKEKIIFAGPRVAHRSSPLFQVCKIWETINSITLKNKSGDELYVTSEKKNEIFKYLDYHEKLSFAELKKILEIKKGDGWYGNKMLEKGIQGNLTKTAIKKCFNNDYDNPELIRFDLIICNIPIVDKSTGEILQNESLVALMFHPV